MENCSATGNTRVHKDSSFGVRVGKVSNAALLNVCLIFRNAKTASTDHFSFFLLFLAGDKFLFSGCNVFAHPEMKRL